jgi:acyl-CoA thioester hydrolase
MSEFRFFHPIEVRYADVDPQRHVNHARYFTYMEQARAKYVQSLGLWGGRDFDAVSIILVEASCTYKAPINYGQPVRVGVRTVRLGTKSLELVYTLQDEGTGREMATGRSVLVAYDYGEGRSIPIPETWRRAIRAFEALDEG